MGGFCIKPHWLFAATLRLCSELIANRELAKEVAFVFVIKIFFPLALKKERDRLSHVNKTNKRFT